MTLRSDLEKFVSDTFRTQWDTRKGQVAPYPDNLKLYNDGIKLKAVVLYADMSESTELVDNYKDEFAAEIYKNYLYCAAKIIRSEGGEITAYDGDRIMAIFLGDYKNTTATRAALKINYARVEIINKALHEQYDTDYEIKHTIGIDSSELFAARTGIRGFNDIVWIGKAANHAAKLCALPNEYAIRITQSVYNRIDDIVKIHDRKDNMWEKMNWTSMDRTIYRSNYFWTL